MKLQKKKKIGFRRYVRLKTWLVGELSIYSYAADAIYRCNYANAASNSDNIYIYIISGLNDTPYILLITPPEENVLISPVAFYFSYKSIFDVYFLTIFFFLTYKVVDIVNSSHTHCNYRTHVWV